MGKHFPHFLDHNNMLREGLLSPMKLTVGEMLDFKISLQDIIPPRFVVVLFSFFIYQLTLAAPRVEKLMACFSMTG